MKGSALVVALGAMAVAMAPAVARAEPQVLTVSEMDAVTAAAGFAHLNLPAIGVILMNVPDIKVTANIQLGDIVIANRNVVARKVITQVGVATSVGIAICGVCFGSSPQVANSAFVSNSFFARHELP